MKQGPALQPEILQHTACVPEAINAFFPGKGHARCHFRSLWAALE
jgi:hypothetical protein